MTWSLLLYAAPDSSMGTRPSRLTTMPALRAREPSCSQDLRIHGDLEVVEQLRREEDAHRHAVRLVQVHFEAGGAVVAEPPLPRVRRRCLEHRAHSAAGGTTGRPAAVHASKPP